MKGLQLPIDSLLPEIVGQIERNTISLLQAEPGAGKTTRVPPALLASGFSNVFVLEPRRLAARMAAKRVSDEMGEALGGTVGYQVRFDKTGGPGTRLWFLTEGIFTNRLLSGPPLPQRSAVVLDEFHERHLETDLALALLRNLLPARPDLRVLIMSATLATELSTAFPGAPLIKVGGRTFPVDVRYSHASSAPLENQVAAAVSNAAATSPGHILVFLPGAGEIRTALVASQTITAKLGARALPLYGDLSGVEQDLAVAPSSTRKIIFATNVAESSVTIDGVTAVVDSGLARIASHSAWTGFANLQVSRISRASAIQRAGRAGRTAPGVAIRLYTQEDFARRPESTPPEVVRADWTETLLRLAAAGCHPAQLPWIDVPSPASLEAAEDLLLRLNALDSDKRITPLGRRLARFPVHPRLARLVLTGSELGASTESAQLAAWLADGAPRLERRNGHRHSSDLEAILTADLSFTARRTLTSLRDLAQAPGQQADPHALEKAVLAAFPDRIATRRGENLLLSNGASANLHGSSLAGDARFLVALDVESRTEQGLPIVRLASPVEPDWLLDLFPDRLIASDELRWNRTAGRVEQVSLLRYDRLIIDESLGVPSDPEAAADLLVSKALEAGLHQFTEPEEIHKLFSRLRFAAHHSGNILADGTASFSEEELLRTALRQIATGLTSFSELRQAASAGLIPAILAHVDVRLLEELAPTHVLLPSGRRAPIEYIDGQPPAASSRLQDFFGMRQSPSVARGAVPLTLKLLAPNGRPVQITTDLRSFWTDLYPQVRRELGRRYPRHSWPESPG